MNISKYTFNWRKELRDQLAHALWGSWVILPVVLWPNPIVMAWSFFNAGMIREVSSRGTPTTLATVWDSLHNEKLDLTCWTLAGLLLGMVLWS